MDDYLRYLLESPPVAPEEPVIYPGIKEQRARADRITHGIPLHPKVVATLRELCRELGATSTI
jgi:LDH2 family malate/lactate/ureidoglycolate dehydrogenase